MKKIEIKIGSQAGIRLLGYDKNASSPFSKWPQMQVHNDGDEVYVNLKEEKSRRIDFSVAGNKENISQKKRRLTNIRSRINVLFSLFLN